MFNHYDPNQPRRADGQWTDAGEAIKFAASDKNKDMTGKIKQHPLYDPTQPRTGLVNNKAEIINQIKDRGLNYHFIGASESHGLSIYYEIEGKKCRFSTHSVTNISRLKDEYHFDLPFISEFGKNGITDKYNDNADKFKRYFGK